ncbi:MAG: hypothetical protein H7X89_15090 [Rhizobiales bacterium]|nr:hypothetical protein [Hyphomicrobiales bacterium]
MLSVALLCFLPQAARAAQVASGMGAGITIYYVAPSNSGPTKRLIVPATVTKTVPANSYTWNAAALSVKGAGFKQPRRMEKSLALYWFQAKRQGAIFRIAVSIASGKVLKVIRA